MLQVLKLSFYPVNRSFYVKDTVSLALSPTLHILSSKKEGRFSSGRHSIFFIVTVTAIFSKMKKTLTTHILYGII